jgi:outer membrane protein OmpA-like peptidoglycan-associated protein
MSGKFFIAVPIAMLAVGGSTACATKKFVKTSVGQVNEKVDSLGRSVEETQERTRQNEGKIADVDQRAQAAARSAHTAADEAAGAASAANNTATAAASSASAAGAKADALDRASKRLVFEVVLSDEQGNFKFAKTELPDEVKARLDDLVTQLQADPKGAYFEIEGHTDNIGPHVVNEKIGLERAEAVKRYLYEHHQIPLHKINVISYGEEKPVAPNNTKDGRAKNRRVVIRVMA